MPAFDVDSQAAYISATVRQALAQVKYKRHDCPLLKWQFIRDGVVAELPNGSTGKFGVKAKADFDGDYLAAALSWSKSGEGSATVYSMLLNLNTTEIEELFTSDSVSEITLAGELEITIEGRVISSVDDISFVIRNDYNQGDEGQVEDANPPWGSPSDYALVTDVAALLSYATNTVSAAGTTIVTKPAAKNKIQTRKVTLGAGSGAYTYKMGLAHTDAVAGDKVEVYAIFAASTNPTLEVRDTDGLGTVIYTYSGIGAATTVPLLFIYTGTAWESLQ